jgi:hypothetical protein
MCYLGLLYIVQMVRLCPGEIPFPILSGIKKSLEKNEHSTFLILAHRIYSGYTNIPLF